MGKELYDTYQLARAVFDEADRVLGFSLSQLCFDGPEPTLTHTINAQPALLAHSIAALRALSSLKRDLAPAFVAGPSVPIPVSPRLERACIPTVQDIVAAARAAARREDPTPPQMR